MRWIEFAAKDAELDPACVRHLTECATCSAYLARVERHVGALRGLSRPAPPRALDGLTVAATQAGFRQERSVRALEALQHQPMPTVLDRRMWPEDVVRAPAALTSRVERDLEDPAAALARRFAGRLERRRAPRGLDTAVAQHLRAGAPRPRGLFVPRASVLLAAAALVLVLGSALSLFLSRDRVEAHSGPEIVIERVASPSQMSAAAQDFLVAVSGGLADPRVISKEKL